MPGSSDEFCNNPFRYLDCAQFPACAGDCGASGIDPADRELFLRFVERMPSGGDKKKPHGFTIGEQCALPRITMKKKTRPVPLPSPVPQKEDREEDIFAAAMRNTTPLGGKGRMVPAPKPRTGAREPAREPTLADYLAGKLEFAVSRSDEYLEGRAVGLDDLILNRLKEGQFSPEAHLDLHGLNAEQAFETLRTFMRQAWFKGLRAVLIVTGRGRNSPAGMGILRHKLPYWLTHEPFKRIVLAFCTALPHDGGPGSIYVLLRKARKKGPVRWETLAFDTDVF